MCTYVCVDVYIHIHVYKTEMTGGISFALIKIATCGTRSPFHGKAKACGVPELGESIGYTCG